MTFLHKSVGGGESLFGSDLKDLRELHHISFEQACRETRIDAKVLKALEEDRLSDFPDPLFLKRPLMTYVRYLGGYEPYFSGRFDACVESYRNSRTAKDLLPRERSVRFWDLFVAPQFLTFLGIVVLAGILLVYVMWQARAMSRPPELTLTSPAEDMRLEEARVVVAGTTMPEATLLVNGQRVAVDEKGNFSMQFDVHRGTNVLQIIARRRRGSETLIERRVVFDQELPDLFVATSTQAIATSTSSNVNSTSSSR